MRHACEYMCNTGRAVASTTYTPISTLPPPISTTCARHARCSQAQNQQITAPSVDTAGCYPATAAASTALQRGEAGESCRQQLPNLTLAGAKCTTQATQQDANYTASTLSGPSQRCSTRCVGYEASGCGSLAARLSLRAVPPRSLCLDT